MSIFISDNIYFYVTGEVKYKVHGLKEPSNTRSICRTFSPNLSVTFGRQTNGQEKDNGRWYYIRSHLLRAHLKVWPDTEDLQHGRNHVVHFPLAQRIAQRPY